MRKGKASEPFYYDLREGSGIPQWIPINRKARRYQKKQKQTGVMTPAHLDPHRALKTEAGYMRWNKFGEVTIPRKELSNGKKEKAK